MHSMFLLALAFGHNRWIWNKETIGLFAPRWIKLSQLEHLEWSNAECYLSDIICFVLFNQSSLLVFLLGGLCLRSFSGFFFRRERLNDFLLLYFFFHFFLHNIIFSSLFLLLASLGFFSLFFRSIDGWLATLFFSFDSCWRFISFVDCGVLLFNFFFGLRFFLWLEFRICANVFFQLSILLLNSFLLSLNLFLKGFVPLLLFPSFVFEISEIVVFAPFKIFSLLGQHLVLLGYFINDLTDFTEPFIICNDGRDLFVHILDDSWRHKPFHFDIFILYFVVDFYNLSTDRIILWSDR